MSCYETCNARDDLIPTVPNVPDADWDCSGLDSIAGLCSDFKKTVNDVFVTHINGIFVAGINDAIGMINSVYCDILCVKSEVEAVVGRIQDAMSQKLTGVVQIYLQSLLPFLTMREINYAMILGVALLLTVAVGGLLSFLYVFF